ncbi:DUF5018 domain-containing protein [Bacteroides sp. BFG-551]|nr:DUF5018 domain-containing protein [Bacteroides sp. BFG-551]
MPRSGICASYCGQAGNHELDCALYFGPYVDKEAVVYTIADASVDKYVIPMPWYYPENSDNETSEYMKTMRVQAKLAPNCTIEPVLSIRT